MSQKTNLNVSPYYDDFDANQNFHKVLFKPGFPVQSRELTTLQSILQNQIESFGNHIFKDGSVVVPGNVSYNNSYYAVKINPTHVGLSVGVYLNNLVGKKIKGQSSQLTAVVQNVITNTESDTDDYTLYVKYTSSDSSFNISQFIDGETLLLRENMTYGNTTINSGGTFATTIDLNATSISSSVSISEGIYFIRGNFVKVDNQTIILDQYTNTPSYRVGLLINESFITAQEDSTLYDNARGFSNYAAPGADRLKITATLYKKTLTDFEDKDFIEVIRLTNGVVKKVKDSDNYSLIREYLAKRTYEESGDYVVDPFSVEVNESLNDNLNSDGIFYSNQSTDQGNTPTEDLLAVKVSPGKAYVKGFDVEKSLSTVLDVEKPRDVKEITSSSVPFRMGNILKINNVHGTPRVGIDNNFTVSLNSQRRTATTHNTSGNIIGEARVYSISATDGSNTNNTSAPKEWELALWDIQTFTELTLSAGMNVNECPNGSYFEGKSSGATGYVVSHAGNLFKLNQTSGSFQVGEEILINGNSEPSRSIVEFRVWGTQDIKSVYQGSDAEGVNNPNTTGSTGLTTAFAADTILTGVTPKGFSPTDTIWINHVGMSTVTGRSWVGIKSDTIISYNQGNVARKTYHRVVSVESGGLKATLAPVEGVAEVANGALPTGQGFNGTFNIAVPHIQNEDAKQLYAPLNSKNISTVNLANSSLSVNRQASGKSTSDVGAMTVTLADVGIADGTFEPFLPNRYSVHYADGTVENLTSGQVTLGGGSLNVNFTGLTANQTNVRVNVTVKKSAITSKNKLYVRSSKLNINNTVSGINTTTVINGAIVNTGLTTSKHYGTRVEDGQISLNKPDVVKVVALYEAVGVNGVALDKLTFIGGLNLDSASVLGEKIIGQTSGAIGQIVTRSSSTEVEFVYLNSNTFAVNETVKFDESKISGMCILVTKGSYINKTQEYTLDKGQKEQYYDYSRLIRKSGVSLPTKPFLAIFDHYQVPSADKGDVYTADSYEGQRFKNDIPSLKGGTRASDVIDFRPRVADFNSTTTSPFTFSSRAFVAAGSNPTLVVASNESSTLGYSYYLPRIDKIVLNKNSTLEIVKGVSADNPKAPSSIEEAMDIAEIKLPAYLYNTDNAKISLNDYKRYTMRDIAKLEDRIKNVEDITSLTLLELDTKTLQVRDQDGIDRFKSGFFVDSFKNNGFIDTENSDTKVTVNTETEELTSDISLYSLKSQIAPSLTLDINAADFNTDIELLDPGVRKTGDLVTLNYSEIGWDNLEQTFATKKQQINPFGVANYNGVVKLTPSSDTWVRTINSETGINIQTQSEWNNSYVSNLISDASISNKLRSRNVEFRASGLQPSTSYYSFFGGNGSIDIIPKLISMSMISGVFQIGETVSGFINGKKVASFRVASANHKTGAYNFPITTYSENPYSTSLSLNTYSASSSVLNVDTYSLADDADGRFYGYLPVGARLVGETSTAQATVSTQALVTDSVGDLNGCFFIRNPLENPAPPVSINVGSKSFKLSSSSTNSSASTVSFTESTFYGSGIVNSSVITESVTVRRAPAALPLNALRQDPLSQTFRTDANGGFLTSLDLFFAEKDTTEPVFVEIREADIGGQPKNKLVQDFARVTIPAAGITTSANGDESTNVRLDSPLYLQPEKQYAVSLICPASDAHKVWIAESNQATVATQTYPNAQQIIYSNQYTAGNLYKPQNGSTWSSSLNEDLKFKLYKANFTSNSGTVYFHNPNVSTGSTYIARDANLPKLTNNPITTFPRKIIVGIETSPERVPLENLLHEGIQVSNSSGGDTNGFVEAHGGNIGVVTTSNVGVGYSNGTFSNVPLYSITGVGENATATVMVVNNKVGSVSVANTGTKYKVGDMLGLSTSSMTKGTGATVVVSTVPSIDTLFLTNVTGQQFNNSQNLFFLNGAGTWTSVGGTQTRGTSTIPSTLYEGNVFEVRQYNHGMNYKGNHIVTIQNIEPDTPSIPITSEIVSSNTSISVGNTAHFTHFEGVLVSGTNPGYVVINEEIISYNALGSGSLTILGRGLNESVIRNHAVNDTVQKYELNRVSLCRINKHHMVMDDKSLYDSTINNNMDSYRLNFSRTSAQPNANTKASNQEMLNFADQRSLGGVNCRATQNIQFDSIIPQFNTITPENTNVSSSLRTISGTSSGGEEVAFNDQGFESVTLNQVNEFSTPRIVASRVNEKNKLSNLPRNKSLTLGVKMDSSNSNVSPVIDLSEAATFVFGRNRINNPVADYTKDSRTNQNVGDPHTSVYISKKVNLLQPATSLKVLLNAYRDGSSDIRVLYKLFKADSSEIDESYTLFPGYNSLKDTDGDGIGDLGIDLVINGNAPNKSLHDGLPDVNVRASEDNEFLSYQYTDNELEEFNAFQIKIVMSGSNEAHAPRIRDLRAIALA